MKCALFNALDLNALSSHHVVILILIPSTIKGNFKTYLTTNLVSSKLKSLVLILISSVLLMFISKYLLSVYCLL